MEPAQVAADVMGQCMGIIDSGATACLGSIDALEALALRYLEHEGETQIDVSFDKKPTFGFGNGMSKTCVSTAQLHMEAGEKQGSVEVRMTHHSSLCWFRGRLSNPLEPSSVLKPMK